MYASTVYAHIESPGTTLTRVDAHAEILRIWCMGRSRTASLVGAVIPFGS
jgi:hypothetical protein